MSIYDKILQAHKRQQPYVNLVNQIYELAEIFNEQNIETYKKIELKALYFRTHQLQLNQELGQQINKLVAAGVREVLIFCDKDSSDLTKNGFNEFLEKYHIRINLKIAQVTGADIEQIKTDQVGQKDLLGFGQIENYQLKYKSGYAVALLNDQISDQVIRNNHQLYKQEIAEKIKFGVKEPTYTTFSVDGEQRVSKKLAQQAGINIDAQLQLEVTQNIDLNLSVNHEIEQENEIDIDQDQLANKFDRRDITAYIENKLRTSFAEETMVRAPSIHDLYYDFYSSKIFDSHSSIRFITQKAADLIIPHLFLFTSGINLNNLPIGLGFKDGIIFASEKRPSSMPIDDFTINFDYIKPTISEPTLYSWLNLASKASTSLSDIYGSENASKIIGQEQHPLARGRTDLMLDLPYNHRCSHYTVNKIYQTESCLNGYNFQSEFYAKGRYLDKGAFPEILFFNLSKNDEQRLQEIWLKLCERNIAQAVAKAIQYSIIKDGGFLLEEKTAIFFAKLFHEILPLPSEDMYKSTFFSEILSNPWLYIYRGKFSFEDIFEGLNAAYNKFQQFILQEDIEGAEQRLSLLDKFQSILKTQLKETICFKTATSKVLLILELNAKSGGNLNEQIEYLALAQGQKLASEPSLLNQAEEARQNIVTHITDVKNVDSEITATSKAPKEFATALKKLASVSPHLRASIDTYAKHFQHLFLERLALTNHCNTRKIWSAPQEELRTAETINSELLQYQFKISSTGSNKIKITWGWKEIEFDYDPDKVFELRIISTYLVSKVPATLNAKVKAWLDGGSKNDYISFSHQELVGTDVDNPWSLAQSMEIVYEQFNQNAAGDASKLRSSLNLAEKNTILDKCYSPLGVITKDANLVHHFTTKQALENFKLLTLNIITSAGNYYDQQYPDQEFSSFSALFSLLFETVKLEQQIEIATRKLKVEEDYNKKTALVEEYVLPSVIDLEVKEKEELHQKMIAKFWRIYQENPQFKFGEIVPLGLIANFYESNIADKSVKQAQELQQYNGYLYQLFRVLLAKSTQQELPARGELKERTDNIVNSLEFLTSAVENDAIKMHELLTDGGKSPENLVFFAACLGNAPEITIDEVNGLLKTVAALKPELKEQLLKSLATTKLPFTNDTITENSKFPALSVATLSNEELLANILEQASSEAISYQHEARFNHVAHSKLKNAKPDFSLLEKKFNIMFSDALKSLSFAELKQAILNDADYIKNNTNLGESSENNEGNLEFEFVSEMFAAQVNHEQSWRIIHDKKMQLLFNPTVSVREQLNQIEYNAGYLSEILARCIDTHQKKELLDLLLAEPTIPYANQKDLLTYLKSLPSEQKFNIVDLLTATPKMLYIKNFPLFKIATDFILNNEVPLALNEFYQLVNCMVDFKDSALLLRKIFKYCHDHNEYSLMNFIAELNSKAKNFASSIEWLTTVKAEDIKQLVNNPSLNLKQLFEIRDIEKIKIIADIALNSEVKISREQYDLILKHVAVHNLDEAKLIKSYLLSSSAQQDTIELVLSNLNSLDKVQTLFANNNLARFSYDVQHVQDKIQHIMHKNSTQDNAPLVHKEEQEIYARFISVMEYCKSYKDLNYNQLQDKAIKLKHERSLRKEDAPELINKLGLEFIALTMEVMYRETGKFPRDTQIIAVLNSVIHEGHLINEIATGQGKSIISALHAAYLWFTGQTVDVVTSSRILAERDLQQFSSFYDALGINHHHNVITPDSSVKDYQKGGVNYAVASDLALFRADREFHSNKNDISLNADVSIVCDEIDATLTSDVNFKLATPLVNTSPDETRVLFSYILEFTELPTFKNLNVSRSDDVKNLQLFLSYQFEKYDSSLHFPLSLVQLDKLKKSNNPEAKKLYTLSQALTKCSKDTSKLFDKLLDSASLAKNLKQGVHFVVLNENEGQETLKAIPIVKDQPSKATVFGDGVQAFLHLVLEKQTPAFAMKFEIAPPSATIFNISPKNFFDYYRLAGGKIIGLTGTAGSKLELEEFATVNKIVAFSIPKFEQDKKEILPYIEVKNLGVQNVKIVQLLQELDTYRPVLVFCESVKHAENIYQILKPYYVHTQLCASSPLDSGPVEAVMAKAGNSRVITVTTPMLGRGTDFFTYEPKGYFAINLCTDITPSSLWQIYGRIARNGDAGTVVSIFNQQRYAAGIDNPASHMEYVAGVEQTTRMRSQPLTDILKYFGKINHDNTLNAILANEFITKSWNKLLRDNDTAREVADFLELREHLVSIVEERYPEVTQGLKAYLDAIDNTNFKAAQHANPAYVAQKLNRELQLFNEQDFNYQNSNQYWKLVEHIATSKSIALIAKPTNNEYSSFYQHYLQMNNAKMLTHTFTLENNVFSFSSELKASFSPNPYIWQLLGNIFLERLINKEYANNMIPLTGEFGFDQIIFDIDEGDNLLAYHKAFGAKPIKILGKDKVKHEISLELINKIKSYQGSDESIPLTYDEVRALNGYLQAEVRYAPVSVIKGDGSSSSLMLDEFKQSFAAYQKLASSAEVNKIAKLVDNFLQIQDIDMGKLESGKYQAIRIVTKMDSSGSHAESILTDGQFLFWINRGAGAEQGAWMGEGTGIKIFKIIKDIEQVRKVLHNLKEPKSQTDTRKDIFSLLREEGNDQFPDHILVGMKAQKIGNCGWTQTKGMLKAIGIISHIGQLKDLPDPESQEWQKALKDSNDIYKDFTTFDRITRAEALLYSLDAEFNPQFLDASRQQEIDATRTYVTKPVTHEVVREVALKLAATKKRYISTIYEDEYYLVLEKLQLETALSSDMGLALQDISNKATAKMLLKTYQLSYLGDFEDLAKIYQSIKASRFEDQVEQKKLFAEITASIIKQHSVLHDVSELTDMLAGKMKVCAERNHLDAHCVITNFNSEVPFEDNYVASHALEENYASEAMLYGQSSGTTMHTEL